MSSFSSLRRSFTHRFHSQSSPPLGPKSRWVSVIAVGSTLGLLYCFSVSTPNSFSFAHCDPPRTSSHPLFSKLSLPETNHTFLFGGNYFIFFYFHLCDIKFKLYFVADAYRRKIFFNYEKRIRLYSPPEKVFHLCYIRLIMGASKVLNCGCSRGFGYVLFTTITDNCWKMRSMQLQKLSKSQ